MKLDSSRLSATNFICHLELSLESKKYDEDFSGPCEENYVQFGRDIMFITSYQSKKICDYFEELNLKSTRNSSVVHKSLDERIYLEAEDNEMDLWIKLNLHGKTTKIM